MHERQQHVGKKELIQHRVEHEECVDCLADDARDQPPEDGAAAAGASAELWTNEADDDGGGALVRTSSAELARQRSSEERSRRAVALATLSESEREDTALTAQLAAVQRDVAAMRSLSFSPGGTVMNRGPGRTNSESPSPSTTYQLICIALFAMTAGAVTRRCATFSLPSPNLNFSSAFSSWMWCPRPRSRTRCK